LFLLGADHNPCLVTGWQDAQPLWVHLRGSNSRLGAILFLLGADHNPCLVKTEGSTHFLAYPGAGF
jgi:hypothetical protein